MRNQTLIADDVTERKTRIAEPGDRSETERRAELIEETDLVDEQDLPDESDDDEAHGLGHEQQAADDAC